MFWEWHIVTKDVGECLVSALALERSSAEEHLIYQYSQSPPIHRTRVATTFNNFRRDVFFRANEGICSKVGYAGLRIYGGQ